MSRIADDPKVIDRLFQRYDYLQDYPLNIKGKCIDEAENLGVLETDDFLGFVLGYAASEESAIADHFPFLSQTENVISHRNKKD